MNQLGKWLEIFEPRPSAGLRLFCFPHAGGAAQFFQPWGKALDEAVEVCAVQPPGRWNRLREPPFRHVVECAKAATSALAPALDRPSVFFGHSLGGLVAFEAIREIRRRRTIRMPSALFVSARKAPHLPLGRPTIYQLAEREFIREMRDRYSAIPPQVLSNKDLLELALPSMRADMEMFDTYEFIPEDPLPVPVHVLGGLDDPNAQKAELEPWTDHTTASCELEMFPGGHFFLNDSRELFLAELDKRLAALI